MVHNKATKVKKAFNLAFLALCRAPGNIWLLPLECAHNPPLVTLLKASITLISPGLLHCGTRVQFLFTLKTELCLNLRSRSIGNGTHVGRRSGYVRVFAPLFPPISWPISPSLLDLLRVCLHVDKPMGQSVLCCKPLNERLAIYTVVWHQDRKKWYCSY